jgi:tetratricopeptide (TPR) repeat protein
MAFEEIERLKEKVESDPTSKLFVPLAEEYKKAGMLDEAIDVLIRGLERHPNYMSARVSLGKIYLEKGILTEASQEFEKVIRVIPDNLYAHKKLAEIYRNLGDKDKTIEELRIVLRLNPTDEGSANSLAALEGRFTVQPEVPETVETMMREEEPSEVPVMEKTEYGEIKEPLGKEAPEEPRARIRDADLYISEDRYAEALDVYRKILSVEPGNPYVLQRIEELRALLKLLGKSEEELIVKLNSFLEGIKKRRNEFFNSS